MQATERGFEVRRLNEMAIWCADVGAMVRRTAQGLEYAIQQVGWIGWHGGVPRDPEGNTVELVAFDATMLDNPQNKEG